MELVPDTARKYAESADRLGGQGGPRMCVDFEVIVKHFVFVSS